MSIRTLTILAVAAGLAASSSAAEPAGRVVVLENLAPSGVRALVFSADRLVWDRETGRAVAELPEAALSPHSSPVPSMVEQAAGSTFEGTVKHYLPEFEPGDRRPADGRWAVMEPASVVKPEALRPALAERRSASLADTTCLSQGFETLPVWYEDGGDWWHYEGGQSQNAVGDYYWLDTDCDAFGGSWSVDAVLGGTIGVTLPCDADYDVTTDSWLEYAPWITCAYGAPGAQLNFYGKVASETGYDFFYYVVSTDGVNYVGYRLSGNFSDTWYQFTKDLRSWTSLGDLTAYPHFALAFVFQSDDQVNTGFGARLDNISVSVSTIAVDTVYKVGNPFRLKVTGGGFLPGAWVYIDGVAVPRVSYKRPDLIVAKGGAALKSMVPFGQPVCVTVVNPNGGTSSCYMYTR